MRVIRIGGLLLLASLSVAVVAQDEPAAPLAEFQVAEASGQTEFRTLDEDIQSLKTSVMDLNRDLFLLEEELLFPANTQVAVFVSMDVGEFFALDSVQITLDGENVAN